MPRIEIDGQELEVSVGTTIMEAATQIGIYIPFFCYHPKLSVAANCRMCLVDVEKQAKPLPACATPTSDGMKISTRSRRARMAQQGVLEFLLINHPLDCPICDQGGECPLQDVTMGYASPHSLYTEEKRVVEDKDIGPLIATEMTRCIQCTRCVRFGQEIGGIMELGATGRGENMAIGTYVGRAVRSELSGNMIDLCPVGALTSKPFRYRARSWELKHTPSLCPHCSTGCSTDVQSLGREVLRVTPRVNEAVNEEWICDKGRFAYAGLGAADRVTRPLLRVNGSLREVSWAEALEAAAAGIERVLAESGPDSVSGVISPQSTNEELFLFQGLLRGLGVQAIEHRLRQTDFRADAAMPLYPALNRSFQHLEGESLVFLCHGFPREQQPLTNHRLRKAVLAGGRVWAVDSVRRDFNYPVQSLVAEAGQDAALYRALARCVQGEEAGAPADVREAARVLREAADPLLLVGSGVMQHPGASGLLAAIAELAKVAGARVGWLAESANSAGAWLLGCVPGRLPGGVAAGTDGARFPATGPWDARFQAWILMGVEPDLDAMAAVQARRALGDARFVVAISAFLGEAETYADVVLPMAVWAESAGSYFNNEGRLQSFRAAVRAAGEARPAWKILRVLADHLQVADLAFDDLEGVRSAWETRLGDFPLDVPAFGAFPEESVPVETGLPAGEGCRILGDWSIYQGDPLVRRSVPLKRPAVCRLHPETADRHGLRDGDMVELQGPDGQGTQLPLAVDAGVAPGAVWLPLGYPGTLSSGGVGAAVVPYPAGVAAASAAEA